VRKMNRMPSSTSRRPRQGRPQPSSRLSGSGISASRTLHWASLRFRKVCCICTLMRGCGTCATAELSITPTQGRGELHENLGLPANNF